MTRLSQTLNQPTPQSEPLNERQIQNSASGYVYALDEWGRLDRFILLGADGPTYYASQKKLVKDNAKAVVACWALDPVRTAARIAEISQAGRAPKNSSAIFALALGACHEEPKARVAALANLGVVCRTSTHLFEFLQTCRDLGRGFGRGLKRAVARWYQGRSAEALAYQAIKYRERQGLTHKRVLQQAHPKMLETDDKLAKTALYRWICGKDYAVEDLPPLVAAHLVAMQTDSNPELLDLITEHRLPWEAIPTESKADPKVWEAMLPHLGLTALIRNLGTFSRLEMLKPLSAVEREVVTRLTNPALIRAARIHPFTVLQALAVYKRGRAVRGSTAWVPSDTVVTALNIAFRLAFKNVVPTGRRFLLALDISGSMDIAFGDSIVTCREAVAALTLLTLETEPWCHVVGFTSVSTGGVSHWGGPRTSHAIQPLAIPPGIELTDLCTEMRRLPMGGTDCAQPMLYALAKDLEVDAFITLTDNETWEGDVHASEALERYRKASGIPAKLVVVGMTSTNFSIGDPNDTGTLNVVGFDSDAPAAISEFVRG